MALPQGRISFLTVPEEKSRHAFVQNVDDRRLRTAVARWRASQDSQHSNKFVVTPVGWSSPPSSLLPVLRCVPLCSSDSHLIAARWQLCLQALHPRSKQERKIEGTLIHASKYLSRYLWQGQKSDKCLNAPSFTYALHNYHIQRGFSISSAQFSALFCSINSPACFWAFEKYEWELMDRDRETGEVRVTGNEELTQLAESLRLC